jgi:hypothetical protein
MTMIESGHGRPAPSAPARKHALSRHRASIGRIGPIPLSLATPQNLKKPQKKTANSFAKIRENPCKIPHRQPSSTLKKFFSPGGRPFRPGEQLPPFSACMVVIHVIKVASSSRTAPDWISQGAGRRFPKRADTRRGAYVQ